MQKYFLLVNIPSPLLSTVIFTYEMRETISSEMLAERPLDSKM
ncbi:MAG: hypothetical protein ACP5TI_05890 [Thermoprotei archaeon]